MRSFSNLDFPVGEIGTDELMALSPRFTIFKELEGTATTRCFVAHDQTADSTPSVILRVLSAEAANGPSDLLGFLLESHAAAKLSHKGIAFTAKPERYGDVHLSVSEHQQDTETLRRILTREGWLEIAQAVDIARQLAGALLYAHEAEVLHLTLQPEAIHLDQAGKVILTGFGVPISPEREWVHRRRSRQLALAYRSPEQLAETALDERSDLYSLGVVFYEMLTDMLPFHSDDAKHLRQKITNQQAPPAHFIRPEIPESLSAIIAKLLADDPANRFQSANDLRSALAAPFESTAQSTPVEMDYFLPEPISVYEDDEPLNLVPSVTVDPALLDVDFLFNDLEARATLENMPSEPSDDEPTLVTGPEPDSFIAPRNEPLSSSFTYSALLASQLHENGTNVGLPLSAELSNYPKPLHLILLATGIALLTAMVVLAQDGRLTNIFLSSPKVSQEGPTLLVKAPAPDAQSNVQGQGVPESVSTTADNQPAMDTTTATAESNRKEPAGSKKLAPSATSPAKPTATRSALAVPQPRPPDVTRLRQQLRQQMRQRNRAKASNYKVQKSERRVSPGKAKPRKRLFRWPFGK